MRIRIERLWDCADLAVDIMEFMLWKQPDLEQANLHNSLSEAKASV
jgi:hypothetical protein